MPADEDALCEITLIRRFARLSLDGGMAANVSGISEVVEKAKAEILAHVEHPFGVLKYQFGYQKTRYCGRAQNIVRRCIFLCVRKSLHGEVRVDGFVGAGAPGT